MKKANDNFKPGQLSQRLPIWQSLSNCTEVLDTISGLKLEFCSDFVPNIRQKPNQFAKSERSLVEAEIMKLEKKGVIKISNHEKHEIISPIFIRPKPDGCRLILNLKETNNHLDKIHFKMETLNSILKLIRPNCYMTSIDLKDAYYSVKIFEKHQKYLKFVFDGKLYKFVCLPNGLTSGPRKFTKIVKVPLSHLRKLDHTIAGYIDDMIEIEDSLEKSLKNAMECIQLFISLGFAIHLIKSVLKPTQRLLFIGFIINSVEMIVEITLEKSERVISLCTKLLDTKQHTMKFVAKVVGTIISTFSRSKVWPTLLQKY